jgi:uncharacterized protein YqiB (DUF1249 family)
MAASDVEVANIALQLLGAKPITSFLESNDRASLANQFYAVARDEVLRSHPWNFAQVRAVLAREAANPAWGFQYQYQLPADPYCLRVIETEPADAIYKIEGRKIVTDEPRLAIRYTARITDPTQFDAAFTMALAQRLAEMMAYPLKESGTLSQAMYQKWQAIMSNARSIDSQEGSPDTADINVLLDVRHHGVRVRNQNPFAS